MRDRISRSRYFSCRSARRLAAESGQALVLALLALALAALLVAGFMYLADTSQLATHAARQQTVERYAADAGVEHALWRLAHESGLTQTISAHSPFTYTIAIDAQNVAITVERILTP